MNLLLDANVLIESLRKSEPAIRLLQSLDNESFDLHISTLTEAEILIGAREHELAQTEDLLSYFTKIEVTTRVAKRAGEFGIRYMRSHSGIDAIDYVLAATADLSSSYLVTPNRKHFPMFPGLLDPYSKEFAAMLETT